MARLYLSDREWRDLFEAQAGRCCVEACGGEGPFVGEHSTPAYFVGGKPDQLMCVNCHKLKTRADKKAIYHAKRLNGEASSQASRRADRAAKGQRPLLQGRGFSGAKRQARSAREIMGAADDA
jgi:hypothetical protein